jgi:hypothetical protein
MSNIITEGLRQKDLEGFVENTFLIDTYKSKMGEDRNVAVLSFRVKDRLPALDLMEFIERGYGFVLDADISSGEESDGKYSVFVEIERNRRLPENIKEIIEGISRLSGIDDWRFRYHKEWQGKPFSVENISEAVPSSPEKYDSFLEETKVGIIKEFLDDALYDDISIKENIITIHRPFDSNLSFELSSIGNYKKILSNNTDIKLDEQSSAEIVYLNKIFGNYEIIKLGENFMIKKQDQAILIKPL